MCLGFRENWDVCSDEEYRVKALRPWHLGVSRIFGFEGLGRFRLRVASENFKVEIEG